MHQKYSSILHGPVADYAWGEGGLDQIVTQLLNQFEGGSTPVDPKLLANLPMTMVEPKHIESGAQCTTCMETFEKVRFNIDFGIPILSNVFQGMS